PRPGKPLRSGSRQGDRRLVKAAARWRIGSRVVIAEPAAQPAVACAGLRLRLDDTVREISRQDSKPPAKRGAAAWRQNWFSRDSRPPQTESRSVNVRYLPRISDGFHVGHGMFGVPRHASA